MSVSPESLKQAISEAYNPNNSEGKKQLWNTILGVMRSGLSWENGNPWKDILTHWDKEHKQHERSKREPWHMWNQSETKHWGQWGCGGHHYRHHGCGRRHRRESW